MNRERNFREKPILYFSSNVLEFDLVVILVICGFFRTKFESPDFPEFRVYFSVSRKNFPLVPPFAFSSIFPKEQSKAQFTDEIQAFSRKTKVPTE